MPCWSRSRLGLLMEPVTIGMIGTRYTRNNYQQLHLTTLKLITMTIYDNRNHSFSTATGVLSSLAIEAWDGRELQRKDELRLPLQMQARAWPITEEGFQPLCRVENLACSGLEKRG